MIANSTRFVQQCEIVIEKCWNRAVQSPPESEIDVQCNDKSLLKFVLVVLIDVQLNSCLLLLQLAHSHLDKLKVNLLWIHQEFNEVSL